MCGRFTNRLTWREIVALYRLSVPAQPERNLPRRYNICPTDTIDAVVEQDAAHMSAYDPKRTSALVLHSRLDHSPTPVLKLGALLIP